MVNSEKRLGTLSFDKIIIFWYNIYRNKERRNFVELVLNRTYRATVIVESRLEVTEEHWTSTAAALDAWLVAQNLEPFNLSRETFFTILTNKIELYYGSIDIVSWIFEYLKTDVIERGSRKEEIVDLDWIIPIEEEIFAE